MATQTKTRKLDLWERAQVIYDRAQRAKRPMDVGERAEYDGLMADIEAIDHDENTKHLTEVIRDPRALPMAGSRRVRADDVVLERGQSMKDWLAARGKLNSEDDELRLGTTLRGIATGKWDGATREARALGSAPGSAGGYMLPTALAADVIDRLRAQTVTLAAGAKTVPMETQELSIARLSGGVTATWRSDNSAVAASDPAFESVTLRAATLTALVRVSRELLADAPNLETVLTNELIRALSVELDRVALRGQGAALEPAGIDAFTAGQGISEVSMGANGAALADFDKLVDTVIAVMTANAPAPTAAVMHPRTLGSISKLKTGITNDKTPLKKPDIIADLPFLPTTSVSITETQGASGAVASRIYVADWSELLIGMRSEVQILPLAERFADNFQVGFIAYLRGDIALAHNASFGRLIGIL
ncbi:MAG: phage major capsid protein [Chloroflexi bacterium]|nr:phage major capsid protein [Chloroflexota bacterium]